MHLRQLKIEGFKAFERVEFHFNYDLNVLTGANNSGKTTVLEAIALWARCSSPSSSSRRRARRQPPRRSIGLSTRVSPRSRRSSSSGSPTRPSYPSSSTASMVGAATPSTWFEEWKALRQVVKASAA